MFYSNHLCSLGKGGFSLVTKAATLQFGGGFVSSKVALIQDS